MNELDIDMYEKVRAYAMSYIVGISTPESAMILICSALFGEDYKEDHKEDRKVVDKIKNLCHTQQDLDPESKKALYENLWDLYE